MRVLKQKITVMAVLAAVLFLPAQWAVAGNGYLSAVPDIPLAPGLREVDDGMFIFDKPEGRIVQITTASVSTGAAVAAFYRKALPNLGWQVPPASTGDDKSVLTFHRDGEMLRITASADLVIFDLTPADLP
ncbi:MAG: hypothetical protein ACPGGG_09075 [Parvibaculales bacterium]